MASITPVKVGRGKYVRRLLTIQDATGAENKYTVQDPSNFFLILRPTTLTTVHALVTVTASTDLFTSAVIGDFTFVTTSTVTPSVAKTYQYVIGPFESARFLDTSTSGRTIGVTVASTSGGPLVTNGYMISAFEVLPSS